MAACPKCRGLMTPGFAFLPDYGVKPVKTLSTIDDETERLRGLVAKLQDRIAVLESIATDPAERTPRAIEKLREPPAEDAPER